MTRNHPPFQGYNKAQLSKAYIKPEHIQRGLERLRKDGLIEPALIAFLMQHGRLDGPETNFLLQVKHPHRPKLEGHYAVTRHNLVTRMHDDLSDWEQGKELKHPVPGMKKKVQEQRNLTAKKKQARERLRAEIRAKRGMSE